MSKDAWLDWYQDKRVEEGVVDFAKMLKEAAANRILDFGCGTGRNTVYLVRVGFEVYGFDWSEAAVAATRQELSREKLDANLQVWDMNQTPLPYDRSFFHGILAMRVLHHTYVDRIKRIASEIERITKTGGLLYVEVPTYEKAMRQKREGSKSKEPEPGTFVPLEGDEAGIPHHHFRKDELVSLFPGFTPKTLDEKSEHHRLTAIRS